MNNEIFVNDLIKWRSTDNELNQTIERVLWIDEGYAIAFLFDIEATKGFPRISSILDLKEALKLGEATKLEKDPWIKILPEEKLSAKEKKIRDNAWDIIQSIVSKEPEIYYRNQRGPLIQKIIQQYNEGREENKLIERSVYKYLRRFWQRGKVKNALLPDYANSGGKGKTRKLGTKKRGRPRKFKHVEGIGQGINITEQDRQIFRIAINKYYRNSKKNSLQKVYKLMLKEYYTENYKIDENNNKLPILVSSEELPTFDQFRYWYEVENKDLKKDIVSREGRKKFDLKYRALHGSSKQETIGPGSRYQIDATVGDVYLVSKYNPSWIIGRPVIYVVIDVFSRMITGVYVGLEGPSWLGAMMALSNTATNKKLFCQKFGIQIEEQEWPCHHLPECILADRGEFIGMSVETMIPNLGIRIENAAAYRADWKGLVERYFRIIHDHVKPFLPGYIDKDFRQRGAKDYRVEAKMNIDQLTELIIELIRYHNGSELKTYNRDQEMISDNVVPIPIELWKWGIKNRSGKLRTIDEDILKFNLMPTAKATITERGVKFKSMFYVNERVVKERWREKARSGMLSKQEKYISISYDPRQTDFIYLPSYDNNIFDKLYLLDPDESYGNMTIYDIDYSIELEKLERKKRQAEQLQREVILMTKIERITSRASEETAKYQDDTISNLQKTSNIRKNRAFEKEKRREEEAFELSKEEESSLIEQKPKPQMKPEEIKTRQQSSNKPDDRLELLRRKRQEKLKKQKGDT